MMAPPVKAIVLIVLRGVRYEARGRHGDEVTQTHMLSMLMVSSLSLTVAPEANFGSQDSSFSCFRKVFTARFSLICPLRKCGHEVMILQLLCRSPTDKRVLAACMGSLSLQSLVTYH